VPDWPGKPSDHISCHHGWRYPSRNVKRAKPCRRQS
jgi:hypothetical protein